MSEQKTFWITGAASGLGRTLTQSALAAGHRVYATDLDLVKLQQAAKQGNWAQDRVLLGALDVRDAEAFSAAAVRFSQRFPRLDVMVNNAGVMVLGPLIDAPAQDVHLAIDVNVKGVMFGSREAAALMRPHGAGHIVNICSLSSLAPVPGLGIYSASKFAVRGYTLALAIELKTQGIAVTCLSPDGINTPMLQPHQHSEHTALVFSGPRILSPQEVSDAILGRVLRDKPLEVVLPESRGWSAKVASLAPDWTASGVRLMQWWGRRTQRKVQL